jgi:DNA-directed RNA polymerase II subunit RPB1
MAKKIQSTLEHTTLKRLTSSTEIWYDPNPLESIIEEDKEIYQTYFEMEENEDISRYSPWVLRIKLDFRRKLDKGLPMEQICARITEEFEGDLKCWHSDDNANNLLILVRIIGDDKDTEEDGGRMEEDVFLKRIEQNILNDITLCGIKNISRYSFICHLVYV